MSTRKRKGLAPAEANAAIAATEAARKPRHPDWRRPDRGWGIQHSTKTARSMVELAQSGEFRIPTFQRPYSWTDAQVVRMLGSLVDGYHIGSLLLWERRDLPAEPVGVGGYTFKAAAGYGCLVLDGQHRLGALVRAFLSGRFAYDCAARAVVVDQPMRPDVLPLALLYDHDNEPEWAALRAWIAETPLGGDKYGFLCESLLWAEVSAVLLPPVWTLDRVVETYRRLNTEGTPMSADDLAAGLARAIAR